MKARKELKRCSIDHIWFGDIDLDP